MTDPKIQKENFAKKKPSKYGVKECSGFLIEIHYKK